MHRSLKLSWTAVLVAPLLFAAPTAAAPHRRTASRVKPLITLHRTRVGLVLANGQGHTLYVFLKDKGGKSSCYGACAQVWPPLLKGKTRIVVGKGVRAKLVGTVRRNNGSIQLTYAHHPLYTYAPDTKPGEANGQGVLSFGGRWYVISPSGRLITRR